MYQQQVTTQVYVPPPFEYDNDLPPAPPKDNNFGPQVEKVKKTRKLSRRETLSREEYLRKYQESKDYWKVLVGIASIPVEEAVDLWLKLYEGFRLDAFKNSTSKKTARVQTGLEEGRLGRLMVELEIPMAYSLKCHHLGLDKSLTRPECLYDKASVQAWKDAIDLWIPKPYLYDLETGKENKLHVHIICESITTGPLAKIKIGKVKTPVFSEFGEAMYVYKDNPQTRESLIIRMKAERQKPAGKRFPRTRGIIGLKNKGGVK